MLRWRREEAVASFVRGDGVEASGYAMATLQGPLVLAGPIVANSEDDARALASALFHSVSSPVRIDVPAEQQAFCAWLRSLGLVEQIRRVEMVRGASILPWCNGSRFALASQAWG